MRNTIELGDAYALTKRLPAEVIDCTLTSVPYWMQREYLPPGHKLTPFEMGRERTPEDYISGLGELFGLIYHRTRPRGVCWVNIGDKVADDRVRRLAPSYRVGELMGLPWRFSDEMRLRGWKRLREVIWNKPDANPRASAGGPLIAHEHVFLFSKGDDPYYDPVAISEPAKYPIPGETRPMLRGPRTVWDIPTARLDGRKILADVCEAGLYFDRDAGCPVHGDDPVASAGPLFDPTAPAVACSCTEIPVDFFAAMPTRLAERCILATTSERGNCPSCAAPFARVVRKERIPTRPGIGSSVDPSGKARRDPRRHVTITETVGWAPSCSCPPADPAPALVFDPFCGSGTTPMVAAALGRDYYAIELNPATLKLAWARIGSPFTRSYVA